MTLEAPSLDFMVQRATFHRMIQRVTKWVSGAICALQLGLFSGCSTTQIVHDVPPTEVEVQPKPISSDSTLGKRAAVLATDLLGSPYRYGGSSPSGFDCSGLVYYVYRQLGKEIPRTSQQQYQSARKISGTVESGDVVFFRINRNVSHVGILIDKNTFVHAPKRGRLVEVAYLNDPYWQPRLVKIGRF